MQIFPIPSAWRRCQEMISAVVLASASSSPSSEQDLFRPHENKPLLQWILESALASDLAEVICVIGNLTKARREIRLVDKRLFWYADAAGCHQNSSSIIAGLWACHPQSQGAMFLSGSPPLVRKELINALIERFKRSSASIFATTLAGRPRGPVLVRRALFPELLKLRDHDTEHSLLDAHKQQTALVEWYDDASSANGNSGFSQRI
jgi:CTP:molybdopterin cytidylyltransferase MocA